MDIIDKKNIKKRQQKLLEEVRTAPIIQKMGMVLSYNENEEAIWDMPYDPDYDHALEGIHGGVFATLIDNAGWFTAAPYYQNWIATVEMQVRLLEPVQGRDLKAVGHIVRIGKRLATTTMEVFAEGNYKVVAVGSGTFSSTTKKAFY